LMLNQQVAGINESLQEGRENRSQGAMGPHENSTHKIVSGVFSPGPGPGLFSAILNRPYGTRI
jgi:hypothetical protein